MSDKLPSTISIEDEMKRRDKAKKKTAPQKAPDFYQVKIPKVEAKLRGAEYVRMDTRPLTLLQRHGLSICITAADELKFKLENGTAVTRPSHVVKWMLEQIGRQGGFQG